MVVLPNHHTALLTADVADILYRLRLPDLLQNTYVQVFGDGERNFNKA